MDVTSEDITHGLYLIILSGSMDILLGSVCILLTTTTISSGIPKIPLNGSKNFSVELARVVRKERKNKYGM